MKNDKDLRFINFFQQKMKERKQRKMARLESGEKAEEKKTIESMRKFDETTVEPDDAGKN